MVYQTMPFLGIRVAMPNPGNKILMMKEANVLILIFHFFIYYSKDTFLANN